MAHRSEIRNMRHDAFISYSRKDKTFAMRLQRALARYTPPRELGLPHRRLDVFRDEEDFTGGEYYQSLDRHLQDSSKLIVLCSPAARSSEFVNDEVRRFASARGAQHIVPLLIAGIPNNEATPEQQAQMAFPDALCAAMKMPLAADYRGFDPRRSRVDRGPWEASWYTTLANLYDLSRAEIEQREKKRRARRRRIASSIAAVALAVLSGLSFTAWKQRQDAIRQQAVADARFLAGRAVAAPSQGASRRLRGQTLIAAESLRKAWTNEGYTAWRRATLQMPPILGNLKTDSALIRMSFTSDGNKLVALCGARHVHAFSVPDLQELKKVDASETAYELAIDAGGERALVYQNNDAFVEIVDLRTGDKKDVFTPEAIRSATFGPVGEALVASLTSFSAIGTRFGDVESRTSLPNATVSVAFSPDGAAVLALTKTSLSAYDTQSGAARWHLALQGTQAWREVAFGDAGSLALVAGPQELLLVNTATGTVAQSLPVKSASHGRPRLLSEDYFAIGNDLYTTSGTVDRILPFADEKPPLRFPLAGSSGRYIAGIDGSPNRDFVVVDLSLKQDSAASDPVTFYVTMEEGHQATMAAFTVRADMMALSSQETGFGGDKPSVLQLVSLKPASWRPIVPSRSHTGDLTVLPPDSRVVARHWQSPSARTFDANGVAIDDDGNGVYASPNGRLFARRAENQEWIVTDTTDKRRITIRDNRSVIEFSPDEQRLLLFPSVYTVSNAATRTVADAPPLIRTWSFPGANLVIGVDQDSMSAGDAKQSVLFDWKSGKVSAGPGSVHSLYAVNPDGQRFATYDHDAILIWRAGDTQPALRSGRVSVAYDTSLHFSPDGTLLAVGACGSVPLYQTDTLELHTSIPIGNSCFAGFTRDGQHVVSHTWHSGVPEPTFHPITLDGVLAETCARVHGNLTAREQKTFGVEAMNTCPAGGPAR